MADEKPKTVEVEALQAHSYNGKDYAVGDTYDIAEDLAASVAAQGKAVRTDRVAVAKKQTDDSEKARKAASHPVEPMTIKKPATAKRATGKIKK